MILTALSISLLTGCQSELDNFNENPNSPTTTTPSLLLAAMEISTFSTHTSGLIRASSIFDQHLAGTNIGQLEDIQRYVLTEQDVNNEWNTIYGTTLMNGHILNRDFADDYPHYNGMGQILTAINLGYATDVWGDVPYDEAFKAAEGIKAPKYNTQEEIYQRLQTILDDAIVNLKKPASSNLSVPGSDDYIFNGDTDKWVKIAYVLKARFALRLTEVDPNAAQKALDFITESGISSNLDDANTFFSDKPNELNQWYAYNIDRRNYMKMGKYFVDYLVTNNDPRLPFMVQEKSGVYSGNAPEDYSTLTSSYIGGYFDPKDPITQKGLANPDARIGIVTYAEAKFIEAEAKFRLGLDAKPALEEAVAASVLKISESAAPASFITSATATVDLANIIQQKYVALFLTMEPYNDFRRTGFPALVPNQDSNTKTIPVRFPIPSDERNYNPNATVVSNVTDKLWWDKN